MDRRTLLAILLSAIVLIFLPMLLERTGLVPHRATPGTNPAPRSTAPEAPGTAGPEAVAPGASGPGAPAESGRAGLPPAAPSGTGPSGAGGSSLSATSGSRGGPAGF